MAAAEKYVVRGPGVEHRCPPGATVGAAISAAITFAAQHMKDADDVTFYARDSHEKIVGYAAVEGGVVYVRKVSG